MHTSRHIHGPLPSRAIHATGLVALVLTAGCGEVDWAAGGREGLDWTRAREAEVSLFMLLYNGGRASSTSEGFAQDAAAEVSSRLGACVTPSVSGTVVTYSFDQCAGAWGITGLSGAVTATYTIGDDKKPGDFLIIRMRGTDVSINGAVISFDYNGYNSQQRSGWASYPQFAYQMTLDNQNAPQDNSEVVDAVSGLSGDFQDGDCEAPELSPPSFKASTKRPQLSARNQNRLPPFVGALAGHRVASVRGRRSR